MIKHRGQYDDDRSHHEHGRGGSMFGSNRSKAYGVPVVEWGSDKMEQLHENPRGFNHQNENTKPYRGLGAPQGSNMAVGAIKSSKGYHPSIVDYDEGTVATGNIGFKTKMGARHNARKTARKGIKPEGGGIGAPQPSIFD